MSQIAAKLQQIVPVITISWSQLDKQDILHHALEAFVEHHTEHYAGQDIGSLNSGINSRITENDIVCVQDGDTWLCSIEHLHYPPRGGAHCSFKYTVREDVAKAEYACLAAQMNPPNRMAP